MPKYSQQEAPAALEKLLQEYGDTLPKSFASNPLRDAVMASPDLKERMLQAVAEGYIEKFNNKPSPDGSAGAYSVEKKELIIPQSALGTRNSLIFVLGHETQHALSEKGQPTMRTNRDQAIEAISKSAQLPHDYTAAIRDTIEAVRAEEGQAHIGGFNALVSSMKARNEPTTLEAIYKEHPARMKDFINIVGLWPVEKYKLKDGLKLGDDGLMPVNESNINAMKIHYADKMPGTFGSNGLLNYRHQAILEDWQQVHVAEMMSVVEASQRDPLNKPDALVAERNKTGNPGLYHSAERDYVIDFNALGVNRGLLNVPTDGRIRAADPIAIGEHMNADARAKSMPSADKADIKKAIQATFPAMDSVVDRADAIAELKRQKIPVPGQDLSFSQKSSTFFQKLSDTFDNLSPFASGARTREKTPLPNFESALQRFGPDSGPHGTGSIKNATTTVAEIGRERSTNAHAPPLYTQSLVALEKLGTSSPSQTSETTKNLAASVALEAHKAGLTSVDHVVKSNQGNGVIAVQGQDIASPQARNVLVDASQAMKQPAEQSLQQLDIVPTQSKTSVEPPQAKALSH